jgi:WD40 repeat protein
VRLRVTPEEWREIDAVVAAAVGRPEAEQDAWVARACENRPELRAEVESLLRAHRAAGEFLEPQTNEGRRIGHYRLLEPLGTGGMGSVYLAEREDRQFHQRVAIKIMSAGLEMRPEAVRRFVEERQILAGLAHPNIARLLDGGYTERGTPYIVMEPVDGIPITEYCDRHQLDVAARLRLFLRLSEGVRYAHQHLVVHRDIKPANVLVTADGIPKLLDFGIARLADQNSARTYTMMGALTPDYASPEQIRCQVITTASDVYSLGVLLYELLTGRLPYRITARQPQEIERVICEQEPEQPDVSCDIDKIVLMALRKDPHRRYASVEQFAEDIGRFLTHRPVIARNDTFFYRSAKFVRRNRWGVLAAVLIAASLLMGMVATTWEAHRANRQRIRAEQQEAQNRRLLYAAHMNLAYQAWESSNIGRTLTLLSAQRPKPGQEDLRGFEWGYLWRLSHRDLLTLQNKTYPIKMTYAPDGVTLAVAGWDQMLRRWNSATGQEFPALNCRRGTGRIPREYGQYAFTPDGRILAAAYQTSEVILWDLSTNRDVAVLRDFQSPIFTMSFSQDGKKLAVALEDRTVVLWDVTARRKLRTLSGFVVPICSLAFSPDGKWLAIGPGPEAGDYAVGLWDAATGQRRAILSGHTNAVWSVMFSPDSKLLATGSWDATARIWDVATARPLEKLQGHSNFIRAVVFSPDGRMLATGSSDSTVKLWNVATREELATLKGHTDYITDMVFSRGGTTLATAGWDHTIKVWDVASHIRPVALIGHKHPVHSVAFSPDTKRVASADADAIKLWDTGSRQERATLKAPAVNFARLAWSPSEDLLAAAGPGPTVRLWDTASGKQIEMFKLRGPDVMGVDFLPGGKKLVAGNTDGTVQLWNVTTGVEIATLRGGSGDEQCLAISPDGRRLATGDFQWNVTLWELPTGRRLAATHRHHGAVECVRFSPDSSMLASASWDRSVRLWDASTLREIDSFQANPNELFCVAFSPDGKTLATGGGDRMVKLWDVATRQELATLKGHTDRVNSLAFSPDGKFLASASSDHTVRLWEAATISR